MNHIRTVVLFAFGFILIMNLINLEFVLGQGSQESNSIMDKVRNLIRDFISDPRDESSSLSKENSTSTELQTNLMQPSNFSVPSDDIGNHNQSIDRFSEGNFSNFNNVDESDGYILTINPEASDSRSPNPIDPTNITVPIGATVIWINNDAVYHQIVVASSEENISSKVYYGDFIKTGEKYNMTFNTPGIFSYYDPIWDNLRGYITVDSEENVKLGSNGLFTLDNRSFVDDPQNGEGIRPSHEMEAFTVNSTSDVLSTNQPMSLFNSESLNTQSDLSFESDKVDSLFRPSSNGFTTSDFDTDESRINNQSDDTMSNDIISPSNIQFSQNKNSSFISPHGETNSFKANGHINSVIVTSSSDWKASGDWSILVDDGEIRTFTTTMAWNNGTNKHTHEFTNFRSDDDDEITLPADNILTIKGSMDVGSNGVTTWEDVESTITIGGGGKIIIISLDHDDTDHHFSGQSIIGTTTYLSACSDRPGPNMEILSECS